MASGGELDVFQKAAIPFDRILLPPMSRRSPSSQPISFLTRSMHACGLPQLLSVILTCVGDVRSGIKAFLYRSAAGSMRSLLASLSIMRSTQNDTDAWEKPRKDVT